MSKASDLINSIVQTGPDNLIRLLAIAEKIPSDSTLQKLITTLNSLIPYIPQLERVFGDSNIKNLERLTERIPDQKTLDKLVNALPILEKLPDREMLARLLDKADLLKGFLDSLEKD